MQDHAGLPHNRQDVLIAVVLVVLVVAVSFVKVICRGSTVKRVLSDKGAIRLTSIQNVARQSRASKEAVNRSYTHGTRHVSDKVPIMGI